LILDDRRAEWWHLLDIVAADAKAVTERRVGIADALQELFANEHLQFVGEILGGDSLQ
jgi:enoyl reductase-like protein